MTRSGLLILMPKLSAVGRSAFFSDLRQMLGHFAHHLADAGLSSRSAMKLGWRRMPSSVNSVKAISATSSGLIQCAPLRRARGTSSGGLSTSSGCHALASAPRSSCVLKPVPTLPA